MVSTYANLNYTCQAEGRSAAWCSAARRETFLLGAYTHSSLHHCAAPARWSAHARASAAPGGEREEAAKASLNLGDDATLLFWTARLMMSSRKLHSPCSLRRRHCCMVYLPAMNLFDAKGINK